MARVTSLAHGGGQGWALAAAHLCGRREMGSFSLCLSSFIRLTGETELHLPLHPRRPAIHVTGPSSPARAHAGQLAALARSFLLQLCFLKGP